MTGPKRVSRPWPTCERKSGRCQLYSEIGDLEDELNRLQSGVDALFNLLEGCSMKDGPTELEYNSGQFFADSFDDQLRILRQKWEAVRVAAGREAEAEKDGPALVG